MQSEQININNLKNQKMKTLLIILISLFSFAANCQTVKISEKEFNTILDASSTIFVSQTVLKSHYDTSESGYLTFQEIRNILGPEKYNEFVNSLEIFYQYNLIFSEIRGLYETKPIMKWDEFKYGFRFANLPTYRKQTTHSIDHNGNKTVSTKYILTPFNN